MTGFEVQKRFEEYQLTRNALIANKFADNKKFCALDDIAPDFTEAPVCRDPAIGV